jgi:protein deglycase
MKRVLVPLAPGFEEIEAVTVIDILRRAEIDVTVAGLDDGVIRASRGVVIVPDTVLAKVENEEFDMIVLPGGLAGTERLKNDPRIRKLIERAAKNKKITAAICAAPMILSEMGMTDGKRVTSHPSVKGSIRGADYTEERVVTDGFIVTSRAPGTAMEFALKLVELLAGPEKVRQVNQGVLAKM